MATLDTKPQPTESRSARPWMIATVFLSVIAVALAIMLIVSTGVFGGQSDAESVAADYHEAWKALDEEAIAAFFPADGSIEFVLEGVSYEGPDAIAEYAAGYYADAVLTGGDTVSEGPFVATSYEWDWTSTTTFSGISVLQISGDQVLTHYIFNETQP